LKGKRFIDWSKSRLFSCRTKNGTKTITVTETFRDADGRVKTVTTETAEQLQVQRAATFEAGGGLLRGLREVMAEV
jgi:hypothetical protein